MHPLFDGLKKQELKMVNETLESFSYKEGEVIFRSGDIPLGLYIIDTGFIEVLPAWTYPHHIPEIQLRKGPRDFFGEMSLIDRRQHTAEVITRTDVEGMLLPKEAFYTLVEKTPTFLFNLSRYVMARLRSQDTELIMELARAKTAAEHFIEQLKVISETSKILNSTLDLDHLLGIILDETTFHTDSDTGTIFLLDTDKNELVSRILHESKIQEIRVPVGVGIVGTVAQTREIINIQDAYEDDRFNQEIDKKSGYHTKNILSVPMLADDGHLVGVVQLLNKKTGPFAKTDEQFIEAMSVHASIAIEKARIAEKMVHSESLAAVGRFAATIVHDFKSPMTVIRGYSDLIVALSKEEKTKEFVREIDKQIDRIVGMTEEVLSFTRNEKRLVLKKFSVSDFLEETVALLSRDAEKRNIELELILPEKEQPARFDHEKLTRVVLNLISNAFEAMKDGGTLTFKYSCSKTKWIVEIIDTGKGIPADKIDSIFDSFVTFGKKKGTGLGLAIVKKVIENHNGTIKVTSKEGKGSTFRIALPWNPEAKVN
ncbi:MAG: ATP-binding protein [Candidatus Electryonea clarkiae]|nr:ATP-binding protein [Candidatus Electryonea clarkiae]